MRKNLALNCRRRPGLDPLESRYLLSGVFEVVEVHPVPALIGGFDWRPMVQPTGFFGSSAISALSSGLGNWPMPGFHRDFSLLGGQFTPAAGFHTYSDFLVAPAFMLANLASENAAGSGSENAAGSTPNPGNMAAVPDLQIRGEASPGSPPPPSQPPPLLFLGGDPGRILHAARDLSTKPYLDETISGSPGDTNQAASATTNSTGGQYAVLAQGASPGGHFVPSVIVPPEHLTALFKPEPGRDDQFILTTRGSESRGNRPVEAAQGNLPESGSAILAGTNDLTAHEAAHPGDAIPASAVDPLLSGNQTKLLLPQAAGLVANAVPFDQAALEKAVDQFFDRLENLGMGQLVEHRPPGIIPLSLALLSTVTAVEVARRRLKSSTGERKSTERQNPHGSEELLGFPELPGSCPPI